MMSKFILSVIDDHGDTWLYPFEREDDADDAKAALSKFEDDGFYLHIQVIPLEKEKTKTEIVSEWGVMLGVDDDRD